MHLGRAGRNSSWGETYCWNWRTLRERAKIETERVTMTIGRSTILYDYANYDSWVIALALPSRADDSVIATRLQTYFISWIISQHSRKRIWRNQPFARRQIDVSPQFTNASLHSSLVCSRRIKKFTVRTHSHSHKATAADLEPPPCSSLLCSFSA